MMGGDIIDDGLWRYDVGRGSGVFWVSLCYRIFS